MHPRIVGLEEEFTDGEHLRFYDYGDFDGLKSIIDAALADDAHRRRPPAWRWSGACTYVHRTAEMIRILAEHSSAIGGGGGLMFLLFEKDGHSYMTPVVGCPRRRRPAGIGSPSDDGPADIIKSPASPWPTWCSP